MERVCLKKPFEPKLDDVTLKWITKVAWKSKWGIHAWYEIDDLVQDGCMIFYKCRDKFKRIPDLSAKEEKRRFMAFFMRAYMNHIYDLGKDHVQTPEDTFAALVSEGADANTADTLTDRLGKEEESMTLSMMLAQAPAEITTMLSQLQRDGAEALCSRFRHIFLEDGTVRISCGKRKVMETARECFTRITGRPDAYEVIRDYFVGLKA